MRLVTEADLRTVSAPAPVVGEISQTVLEEPGAASALLAFLTLSESPELFIEAGWPAESVFWSRYYWFRRFTNFRSAVVGTDAGLEQQAIQILEVPLPACTPDWSQLELVERKASLA